MYMLFVWYGFDFVVLVMDVLFVMLCGYIWLENFFELEWVVVCWVVLGEGELLCGSGLFVFFVDVVVGFVMLCLGCLVVYWVGIVL